VVAAYCEAFDRFDFSTALSTVWGLISEANKAIVEAKPWELAKSSAAQDQVTLRKTLYIAAEYLRVASVLLYPVIPLSAQRVWRLLGKVGRIEDERIDSVLASRHLEAGTPVEKVGSVFPRLDKAATLAKLEALAEADFERDKPKEKSNIMQTESGKPPEPGAAPSPQSPAPSTEVAKISIEDFAKVEMRVGQIQTAEPVTGAQKLMKLTVDIGSEVRQVVAGIAEHYKPEQLVGMKVVIVTNLEPRKLRGVESNGMIIAASVGPEGKPVLVNFKEDVQIGARLK
jgi:methionyl-tRNA synthetase